MPAEHDESAPDSHGDDLELAQKAAGGDKRAQRMLVDRLMNRVRSTVGYLAGGHADADDYAQLALVEILKSLESYRGETKLDYWADKIAVRTAMRHIKKKRRLLNRSAPFTPEIVEGTADSPHRDAARQRLRKRLAAHIAKLKPERRTVVTLRLVHEYSISEIADITGAPINTVRDRLRVGKKNLQKSILADDDMKAWARSK